MFACAGACIVCSCSVFLIVYACMHVLVHAVYVPVVYVLVLEVRAHVFMCACIHAQKHRTLINTEIATFAPTPLYVCDRDPRD